MTEKRLHLDDLEWLLDTGTTHPDVITKRLGVGLKGIQMACYRAGRNDLARRITDPMQRERRAL